MKKFNLLSFCLLILIFSTTSKADIAHYKNILIGDRAAILGGTYIALSEDTSGTFYNPAGIAYSSGSGISGTVNVYHVQHARYKNAIRSNDWERHSSEILPNFFGLIKSWGNHTFGVSLVVPDSFVQHQDQVFLDLPATATKGAIERYTLNMHTEDYTYLFGPTYTYKILDNLSAGLTLNYHYRKNRMQNYQTMWLPNNQYELSRTTMEWSENGINPKLGIRWNPIDNLSVGLVFSHTFLLSSTFESQITTKDQNETDLEFESQSLKNKRNMPTQIGLGFAFYPSKSLLLVLDVNLYIAPKADIFYPYGYRNVINVSLGAEYSFNKRHVVGCGFFTNHSNMPKPTAQTTYITKINLYGISIGYSLNFKSTSFTLGIVYSYGSGHAQIHSETSNVVNAIRYSYTGILSTNYKF